MLKADLEALETLHKEEYDAVRLTAARESSEGLLSKEAVLSIYRLASRMTGKKHNSLARECRLMRRLVIRYDMAKYEEIIVTTAKKTERLFSNNMAIILDDIGISGLSFSERTTELM